MKTQLDLTESTFKLINRSWSLLVNPVREAPALMRVGVSVSRMDEAVLEWPTDVMC